MRITVYISMLLLCTVINVFSQDSTFSKITKEPYSVGFYGGFNYVMNQTTLPIIRKTSDCGTFENGNKLAWLFGVFGEYDLWSDFLFLDLNLSFEKRPIYLEKKSNGFEVFNQANNEYEPLVRLHTYQANIFYIGSEISARVSLPWVKPFYFKIGAEAANPISVSEYEVAEEIVSPSGVLFPNGQLRRVNYTGDVKNLNSVYGANFGIGAEFKLNQIQVLPELSFRYGLNSTAVDNWQTQILRFTLAARFDIYSEKEFTVPKFKTIPITEKVVEMVVDEEVPKVVEEVKDVKKYEIESITSSDVRLLRTVVTQTYPILPYIFYGDREYELNEKYKSKYSKEDFDIENISKNTLDIYYQTLDIIGYRMRRNNSEITINGVTDGKELVEFNDRINLAKTRAEKVSDYLEEKWGIDGSRIKIIYSDLPSIQTKEEYSEGAEENRRVEISSTDPKILAPIVNYKFLEFKAKRDDYSAQIEFDKAANFQSWEIKFISKGSILASETGNGNPPNNYNFKFDEKQIEKIGNNGDLIIRIEVQDSENHISSKEYKINVVSDNDRYEVGRLNLIVFDFDKSEISQANKVLIQDFANSEIQNNSITKVIGSTDRLGEANYNSKLSQERAYAVANFIRNIKPEFKIHEVRGIGSQNLIYDNTLPEGRFYCRTVLIEVQTPVE